MGLGKTVQVCAAIVESRKERKATYNVERRSAEPNPTALIFCPTSIKKTWKELLVMWGAFNEDEIFIVRTGKDIIPETAKVVILGYEMAIVKNIYDQLFKRWFTFGVMDECQRLKSLKGKRTNKILGNKGNPLIGRCLYKWGLSGTWMPNRPIELYPILKTLAPQVIAPHTKWDDYGNYFCDGFEEDFGGFNFKGASHIPELRERIKKANFALRRTVDEVFDQLPPVVIQNIWMDIGEMIEDESNTPGATLRKAVGVKKLPFAVDYIKDWLEDNPDDKLLAFTFTRDVSEGLYKACSWSASGAVSASIIYGGQTEKHREQQKKNFIEDPEKRLLVMQIDAAGEGTDGLQYVCNNYVSVELNWSDGKEDQLMGRLRRIGQTKICRYTRLIAEGTLDDPMHGTVRKKRKISTELFRKDDEQMIEDKLDQLIALGKANNELLAAAVTLLDSGGSVAPQVGVPGYVAPKTEGNDATPAAGNPATVGAKSPGRPRKEPANGQGAQAAPAKNAAPVPAASVGVENNSLDDDASLEDVQNACRNHLVEVKANGQTEKDARADILAIFNLHGAKGVADLPKDAYNAVLEAIEALGVADPLGI